MKDNIRQIAFKNHQVPNATFDFLRIEELFQKEKNLDHSLQQLHKVGFYMIIFIIEGTGKHTVDFTDFVYQKGTILTIRKDQIHKFFINDSKGVLLLFKDDFLVSYLEKLEALKSLQLFNELLGVPKIQLTPPEYQEISHLINNIQNEYLSIKDQYSLGIIRSLLHIFITKLYRIKAQKEPLMKSRKYLSEFLDFQELVENHAMTTKKVKDYAVKMGVTTKTLNNMVKSILNKSAKTFIDEIVITQIKRHLINSELSIKEIAYEVGFDEPTNFYKYFKNLTNITPETYRKSYRS